MKFLNCLFSATLCFCMGIGCVSCGDDDDDQDPIPIPTPSPTPSPTPDSNPTTQSTSGCIYTDASGQRFVLDKIIMSDEEDGTETLTISYNTSGQVTRFYIDADDEQIIYSIDYDTKTIKWNENGYIDTYNFTTTSEGYVSSYTASDNSYKYDIEYDNGYLSHVTFQDNDIHSSSYGARETFIYTWEHGGIVKVIDLYNSYSHRTDITNTIDNPCRIYPWEGYGWNAFPDGLEFLWMAGMLGKAPSKLPSSFSCVYGNNNEYVDTGDNSFTFNNGGLITRSTHLLKEGGHEYTDCCSYSYRSWE